VSFSVTMLSERLTACPATTLLHPRVSILLLHDGRVCPRIRLGHPAKTPSAYMALNRVRRSMPEYMRHPLSLLSLAVALFSTPLPAPAGPATVYICTH
jgi:hypothetical protein